MKEILAVLPEIYIALTLAAVLFSEITYYGEEIRFVKWISALGLIGAGIQVLLAYNFAPMVIFGGSWTLDGFSLFLKVLVIVVALFTIAMTNANEEIAAPKKPEYFSLILAACLAMCVLVSAADFLLIFVSLQLFNIINYFLSSYGKGSFSSIEASIKYMAFSSVGAAFLLYGFAILFGLTHSLNLFEMHKSILQHPLSYPQCLTVFICFLFSFVLQVGAFPTYFLGPDLLEGSPTPTSAFISLGSRVAGFTIAIRMFLSVFAQPIESLNVNMSQQWEVLGSLDWSRILGAVAGITMLIGPLIALRQKSAKRLVGALVIGETGFLMLGILVLDRVGIGAILYNFGVQVFSLVGIFYIFSWFRGKTGTDSLEDFRTVIHGAVPECICLALFLMSLVGVPPMPGFFGKFALLGAVIENGRLFLGSLAVISSALSVIAAARFLFFIFGNFKSSRQNSIKFLPNASHKAFLLSVLLPLILVSVFSERVINWAGNSLPFIFW